MVILWLYYGFRFLCFRKVSMVLFFLDLQSAPMGYYSYNIYIYIHGVSPVQKSLKWLLHGV